MPTECWESCRKKTDVNWETIPDGRSSCTETTSTKWQEVRSRDWCNMRSTPSADGADGRQSRQPITCVSVVAGAGNTSKKWTKVTVY